MSSIFKKKLGLGKKDKGAAAAAAAAAAASSAKLGSSSPVIAPDIEDHHDEPVSPTETFAPTASGGSVKSNDELPTSVQPAAPSIPSDAAATLHVNSSIKPIMNAASHPQEGGSFMGVVSGSSSMVTNDSSQLKEPLLPSAAAVGVDESGDDFDAKEGTIQTDHPHNLPEKLSALLDQAIEMGQMIFGVGGYTMTQELLRWSMVLHVLLFVSLTYFLAAMHVWAVVTIPIMIFCIWLVWTVHLKSVTTVIKTSTRLDFILSGMMPEKETAWWLNAVMRAIWPVFLKDFLSNTIVPKLAPWFLNKYKPPVLLRVDVMDVDMGDLAPVVSNIRFLQGVGGENHAELEMDLEVASADNMFIQCGAKVVGMSAITWQAFVTGMHLTGTVRIGLKFKASVPFIDRISIMFPTPPQLSCAIKVMGGFDAASMPVVAGYVEATMQAAINAALCWPNRILVVDAVKAVAHLLDLPLPESVIEGTTSTKPGGTEGKAVKLKKPLTGPQAATAVVEIVEAEDLLAADSGGTSDPYVKGTLGPAYFTTGVIMKTLSPKWVGEVYELPVVDWSTEENYTLHLKMRDYDKFSSDDELGFCTVDLRQMRGGMPQLVWMDLQDVETGTLCVRVTIKDDVGLSEEEREMLLQEKKAQETLRAKRLAGLLGKIDPGAAETAAGMLGSIEAFDPKSLSSQAGSMILRNYRKTAEGLVNKNLLPKSLLGGDTAAMIKVEVVEAQNLVAADRGGTSDPYVKGILGKSKFNTQVIYKNLNPKWLENHTLGLAKWPESGPCPLRLEVWDRDRGLKDDFLGKAEVDLMPLRNGVEQEMLLKLEGAATGSLRVIISVIDMDEAAALAPKGTAAIPPGVSPVGSKEITETQKESMEAAWKPPGGSAPNIAPQGEDYKVMGVLTATKTPAGISSSAVKEITTGPAEPPANSFVKVEIIEAAGLEAKDVSGTSDPFVKGSMGSVQFNTKTINKTLSPKWYDAYKLPIVEWHGESTNLTLEVFDKNAVTSNVSIGRCIINLNKFKDGMRHDLWVRLENAKSGKIHIAITSLEDTLEVKSELMEVIPGVMVESWKVQSEHLKGKFIQA